MQPEQVLAKNCLNSYKNSYLEQKEHKAFVYARESDTGKDRCGWGYGYATVEEARNGAMKQCADFQLNAECKIIDVDGVYLVKSGDFSPITPPDNTLLTEAEEEQLLEEARSLIRGNCLPFFKDYLKDKGHKVFAYSLDADGKYACGKTYQHTTLIAAQNGAIKGCQDNKNQRGNMKPKSPCKHYAQGNKILLTQKDFGMVLVPKSNRYLSSEEYSEYLSKAKEIISDGPCVFQMKYYLRSKEHAAYYLAQDENGVQACGRSEDAFTPTVAKANASQKCEAMVKKKKLKATCKLVAANFDFIAKAEDFALKESLKDYTNAINQGNLAKIKHYINAGYDVNLSTEQDGMSPLFAAAAKKSEALFFELVNKQADLNHKAKDGSSLLHAAALGGNTKILKYLLAHGLDIDAKGREGNTALHAALGLLNTDVVKVLMQEGADANIQNDKGISAYAVAQKWKIDLDSYKRAQQTTPQAKVKITPLKGVKEKVQNTGRIKKSEMNKPLPLHETLKNTADTLNKDLPNMLDAELRLDKVTAQDNKMNFEYTLVHFTAQSMSAEKLNTLLYEDIKTQVCTDTDSILLLKKGMLVDYVYHGNDKKDITTFAFDAKVCGLLTHVEQIKKNILDLVQKRQQ